MNGLPVEILEDKHQVEVFESELSYVLANHACKFSDKLTCTLSRCAISISLRVTTIKGGSVS